MKTLIISLGGSIIVPRKIDVKFLKGFKKLIINSIKKYNKIILVTGGGYTCRKYQKALSEIVGADKEALDWMGISTTHCNAFLLKCVFQKFAFQDIVLDPTKKIKTGKRVIIAAGWKPGCSTDKDAVLLAKNFKAKTIINLTNIESVYDKDPKSNKDAVPLKHISWNMFQKIVGEKWTPGLNMPFDPIASKLAKRLKLKVIIAKGTDIKNIKKILDGKEFKGTIIE